jgi:hypothetical protein
VDTKDVVQGAGIRDPGPCVPLPGADGLVVEFAAEQQRVAGRVWTWVALVDDQDERRFLITIRVVGCEAWPQGPVSKQASSSSK